MQLIKFFQNTLGIKTLPVPLNVQISATVPVPFTCCSKVHFTFITVSNGTFKAWKKIVFSLIITEQTPSPPPPNQILKLHIQTVLNTFTSFMKGTNRMSLRSRCRRSMPSTVMAPSCISIIRKSVRKRLDFPEPVLPTMPSLSPGTV